MNAHAQWEIYARAFVNKLIVIVDMQTYDLPLFIELHGQQSRHVHAGLPRYILYIAMCDISRYYLVISQYKRT